jgi:hypothetical protein
MVEIDIRKTRFNPCQPNLQMTDEMHCQMVHHPEQPAIQK